MTHPARSTPCVDSAARVYVLNSHLCLERTVAYFFTERRAFPLSDVFAVLGRQRSATNSQARRRSESGGGGLFAKTMRTVSSRLFEGNNSGVSTNDGSGSNGSGYGGTYAQTRTMRKLSSEGGSFLSMAEGSIGGFGGGNSRASRTSRSSIDLSMGGADDDVGADLSSQEPVICIQMRGASLTLMLPKEVPDARIEPPFFFSPCPSHSSSSLPTALGTLDTPPC